MNVGSDGRFAPDRVNGVPYLKWVGVLARLGTKRGWRVMRPEYGLDTTPFVDRKANLGAIEAAQRAAVSDIDPEGEVIVTQTGGVVVGNVGVTE